MWFMRAEDFRNIIQARLQETGQSRRSAAVSHGLPGDAISRVLSGHEPKLERIAAICEALGLEFYVGPRRAAFVGLDVHACALALRDMETTIALMDNDPAGDASTVDLFVRAYGLYVETIDRVAATGRTREEAAGLLRRRGRPMPPEEFLKMVGVERPRFLEPGDLAAAKEAARIVHDAIREPSGEPAVKLLPPAKDQSEEP